ncbi:MAG: TIGR03067 domain-containing protein [Pirellulales bacterium]
MVTTPEGTWTVVSVEMEAKAVAHYSPPGEQWTFASGQLTVRTPVVERAQFSYTVDRSKTPAEIDLKKLDSPETPPAGWLGIYRIDGDILTICAFPDIVENMPRPSEFQTEKGDLQVLWKMKRVVVAQPRSTTTGVLEK